MRYKNKYVIHGRISEDKFRERIAQICDRESPFPKGEFEVDESYFGPRRVKGKRGRGTSKKTPVFGILKRGGKVYTEIVPDCTRDTLIKIIRGKVSIELIIHSIPSTVMTD